MNITRIKNDINGNGRMVVHFTEFDLKVQASVLVKYDFALFLAKTMGGKRYHNKLYGGGIAFQSYSRRELELSIEDVLKNAKRVLLREKGWYAESDARIVCKYEGLTKRRRKNGWNLYRDGVLVEFLPKLK